MGQRKETEETKDGSCFKVYLVIVATSTNTRTSAQTGSHAMMAPQPNNPGISTSHASRTRPPGRYVSRTQSTTRHLATHHGFVLVQALPHMLLEPRPQVQTPYM
ncbi:hypothetical protein Vretifemale_19841 [Volvox reticuliferus]|uniref:Uncharacterized protein n=1 Tax=Volvox reticuliferus TaxID=1737510 RepID=A0A8J4CYQ3_9CHLO|nr:hypothetical protein Vretifemale_19841 [Volvox reticuliferus]